MNRIGEEFKYISVFELEVDNYSEEFHIKERIMGVRACNIVRIFYLVEKAYAFGLEVEQKDYKKELDIKMIVNKSYQNIYISTREIKRELDRDHE